jgi:[ribosomal protein S5]-alanine N-acetyltransferase
MFDAVIQTARLRLRPYRQADLDDLATMFADPEHMRWYPTPFTREETQGWIDRQFSRYENDGFGLFLVEELGAGGFAGTVGPSTQDVDGESLVEIGWHIRSGLKGRGYAAEAGEASRTWAFEHLEIDHVISLIRPENVGSNRVAQKLGFRVDRETTRAGFRHFVYRSDRLA